MLETHEDTTIRDRCWYQPGSGGGRYWHENDSSRWVFKNSTQFTRWLQSQGITKMIPEEQRKNGVTLSELDALLTELETERLIEYAGGLAGWKAGVHEINKNKILVTHSPELIEKKEFTQEDLDNVWDMKAYGWPVLGSFLSNLFNGIEREGDKSEVIEQLPRFITWLWHFMTSLYASKYSTGMALAMAGEPECGKTLLSELIKTMAGGIVARPYRYMVGQDNFNEEFLEAALLLVDDENSDTHIQQRLKFASELKQIVATRGTRIRAMHQKAMILHPIQRLMICVNLEPERIQVLPPIDTDIRDKLLVLKGYSHAMPMPTRTYQEQEAFWNTLMTELPHFIHWLLEVYSPPLEQLGRFGPKAWQHPAILEELSKLNPETRTEEFIQRYMQSQQPQIRDNDLDKMAAVDRAKIAPYMSEGSLGGFIGTIGELRTRLISDGESAPLTMLERREVRPSAYLGRDLTALSRKYPDAIWQTRSPGNGARNWIVLHDDLPSNRDSMTETDSKECNDAS